MSGATEILPGLWIGDEYTARNKDFFIKHNIRRCINVTPDVPCLFPWVQYLRISVGDSTSMNNQKIMADAIPHCIPFIGTPSRSSAVLVHCQMGVSRSATVVVAYLRSCCFKSIAQSIQFVLSKRRICFFGGKYVNFRKALEYVFTS